VEEEPTSKRIGPWWLPYLSTPVGIAGLWTLHALGVLGPTPLWVIMLLIGVTVAVGAVVEIAARHFLPPGPFRTHLRVAGATVCTTAVIYATGWGSVIAIGYVLAVIDGLRTEGSRAWRNGALWSLVTMACGELAIQIGVAPSILPMHVAHTVAAANAACLVIVLYSLGTTTAAAEKAQQDVADEREHFRSLVQHAADVIVVVDENMDITYVSPAVSGLLGYDPDECVGRPIGALLAPASTARDKGWAQQLEQAGGSIESELQVAHRDGTLRILEITSTLRPDGTIVGNLHDVTRQRALERQLRHQAEHDSLTGLMNRAALIDSVEQYTVDAVIVNAISVLFVDLDGFKEVNDELGHERGDVVLIEAARRITAAVPEHALTGRLGGDEFLVVLPYTDNHDASLIASRILDALEAAWPLPGSPAISASIGVATTGEHPESVEDVLRRADEAMYDAKRQGKGRYALARAA
jgi:diguanylate cyclase (GGDEF)-like protein/PAS domain S-box-containing protein